MSVQNSRLTGMESLMDRVHHIVITLEQFESNVIPIYKLALDGNEVPLNAITALTDGKRDVELHVVHDGELKYIVPPLISTTGYTTISHNVDFSGQINKLNAISNNTPRGHDDRLYSAMKSLVPNPDNVTKYKEYMDRIADDYNLPGLRSDHVTEGDGETESDDGSDITYTDLL